MGTLYLNTVAMATIAAILLLVYLLDFTSGYVLMDEEEYLNDLLILPSEYHIKVERIDLITDTKMPMELWFSSENNRSRADVYDGMVRRYFYWGNDGATGTDGKIYIAYPKWTVKEGHTVFCDTSKMIWEKPTDAFPSEEEYVYAGNTVHEGQKVDVWKFSENEEDTRREIVLYSYRTKLGEDIPVQWNREKKMNKAKGSIVEHLVLNYEEYNSSVSAEDIDAEKESECEWTTDDFHGRINMLHPAFNGHLDAAFDSFQKHHNREYQNEKERNMRKEAFHKNWQLVVNHNQENHGFKLALNHLSDLTPAERSHLRGARRSSNPSGTIAFPSEGEVRNIVTQIPEEYDMRLEGFISPIKNQDRCGSCWTFATAAAVEGALARLDGRILDLSEQSILDCSWEDENEGCNGGFPKTALKHIMKYGLPLEEDYGGYLVENGYCHIENVTEVFNIRGFTLVTPQSVNALKVALYKYGPVVATLQTNEAFVFYSSGVYYDSTCKYDYVTHAVTIVGYGMRDGVGYWIIKNSFGEQWGEGGYILMSQHNNNCYILNEAYYPVL